MNVIPIKDIIIKKTFEDVWDTIECLEEDYGLETKIKKEEIKIILEKFYEYYESKELVYAYQEQMKKDFEDIAFYAVEGCCPINFDSVLNLLYNEELLCSHTEIDPIEVKKMIGAIRKTKRRGVIRIERKHH